MTDEQINDLIGRYSEWTPEFGYSIPNYQTQAFARALLAAGASEGQAVINCGECACLPGICDKEEALKPAGYVIPQRLQSDDPVISLYRKPEGGARKPLYTHPSAEIAALRERIAGVRMEALKEARHVVYMALSLNDAFNAIEALVDKEPKQ